MTTLAMARAQAEHAPDSLRCNLRFNGRCLGTDGDFELALEVFCLLDVPRMLALQCQVPLPHFPMQKLQFQNLSLFVGKLLMQLGDRLFQNLT
mmetsp:Transcript_46747/g.101531  ORF Transcript_46747/g.101531 Transcript_46747/m.101531 type:complete len:93 (-) Transcript_46747:589-867(-)